MSVHTTVADLAAVIASIAEAEPAATFERNAVGNLVVVVDGRDVGYVDLMEPGYYRFDEVFVDD